MSEDQYSFEFLLPHQVWSLIKAAKPKQVFTSPSQFAFGSHFYLQLYPNGYSQNRNGKIELFLNWESIPTNVRSIEYLYTLTAFNLGHSYSNTAEINRVDNGFGWQSDEVLSSRLLDTNDERIQCDIEILGLKTLHSEQEIPRHEWKQYYMQNSIGHRTQFEWHINPSSYRALMKTKKNEMLSSFVHSAFNCKWKIEMYPKGQTHEHRQHLIGIYLSCDCDAFPETLHKLKCMLSFNIPELMFCGNAKYEFSRKTNVFGFGYAVSSSRLSLTQEMRIVCTVQILRVFDSETKKHVSKKAWVAHIGAPFIYKYNDNMNDQQNRKKHKNKNNNSNDAEEKNQANRVVSQQTESGVVDQQQHRNNNNNNNNIGVQVQLNTIMKVMSDMNYRMQVIEHNMNSMELQVNEIQNKVNRTISNMASTSKPVSNSVAGADSEQSSNINHNATLPRIDCQISTN